MAGPMSRAGAVQMLEEGVHLLREAPPGTLACFWIGAVPFVLAALRFWNDITNPRTPDVLCLAESSGLALLLIWMNSWRAVFAGKLRRHLSGAAGEPWTGRRIWRLVSLQSLLGASRLIVLPGALLIGFPLASVLAFYRDAAALSDRSLEPGEVLRRARHIARQDQKLTWSLLAFLAALGTLVAFNVLSTMALLPQLARMLTGYESVFSRGGQYFVANGMFAAVVVAITWLAFDPYVQAVFVLRGFQAESVETGEDLRVGLRRIRGAAAALLIVLALVPHASAAVSGQELRQASREALAQHEYDWRLPPPAAANSKPWLIDFTDHAISGLRKAVDYLGDMLGRFFRWLTDRLSTHVSPGEGAPPALGLNWTVAILVVLAIAATGWIAWRKRRIRRSRARATGQPIHAIHLEAEDLTADRLPEEEWLAMAERCLNEGDLRLALRALYLANLAWLGRREWIAIHPGKTNREYESEMRRRARDIPDARELFAANVRAFECVWYGNHEVTAEEIARFRGRAAELKLMGGAA